MVQSLIKQCFEKKILVSREALNSKLLKDESLTTIENEDILIINPDNYYFLEKFDSKETLLKYDQLRVDLEMKDESEKYIDFLRGLKPRNSSQSLFPLELVDSFENIPKKYDIRDFTKVFVSRYKFMEELLRTRQELVGVLSISKILNKKDRESVSLIGVVSEINLTRKGNYIITLEDLTGQVKILINQDKQDLCKLAQTLVVDEVLGVSGMWGGEIIFADNLVWPDIPLTHPLKKVSDDIYAVFLSDVHVGSTNFLGKEFDKFLDWLNGRVGNEEQQSLASKIKYVFIVGDLVDGIGIYPGQDKELEIEDIYEQYNAAAHYLSKIPKNIQIVICPGNHDALHLAEPQPAFNLKYVQPLLELPNVVLVSNPALVNICASEDFSGFDVLLYHGYSFDYYVANVDSIRNQGGYNRADLIMKFLLKRRHLAPSFTSTPYLPLHAEDPLLIKKIPDFFITGHIHYAIAANYRNVTMISGSCWQSKTSFQEKVGHEPEPARVPMVNLKTREIKILKFG